MLVDEDGYIQLTAFDYCKFLKPNELARSFLGLPEYLAPEIVDESGHSFSVDWWALGIFIYELVVGMPPFYDKNVQRIYTMIRNQQVAFPDPVRHKITVSDSFMDLVRKLLNKNKDQRLGANGGLEEVKSHAWFADIDFDLL